VCFPRTLRDCCCPSSMRGPGCRAARSMVRRCCSTPTAAALRQRRTDRFRTCTYPRFRLAPAASLEPRPRRSAVYTLLARIAQLGPPLRQRPCRCHSAGTTEAMQAWPHVSDAHSGPPCRGYCLGACTLRSPDSTCADLHPARFASTSQATRRRRCARLDVEPPFLA
jgi:hypothetical protein